MKLNKQVHELFREAQAVAGMHNVDVAGYLVLAHCILELRDSISTTGVEAEIEKLATHVEAIKNKKLVGE